MHFHKHIFVVLLVFQITCSYSVQNISLLKIIPIDKRYIQYNKCVHTKGEAQIRIHNHRLIMTCCRNTLYSFIMSFYYYIHIGSRVFITLLLTECFLIPFGWGGVLILEWHFECYFQTIKSFYFYSNRNWCILSKPIQSG